MRYTYEVGACALGCAAAVIAWSFILGRWRTRRGRRFCPGPRRPTWKWALPWHWFIFLHCGYDLAGLRAESSGAIPCPECGRKIASLARSRTHAGRVRWRALLLTTITLTWASLSTPYMRDGRWIRYVPHSALVAHWRIFGQHGMGRLNMEVQSRLWSRVIPPEDVERLIPALIHDLRSGGDAWNEEMALNMLVNIGQRAIDGLEGALNSSDRQQRVLAASALRRILATLPPDEFPPSARLLRVTADSLRSDVMPYDFGTRSGRNAWRYSYLLNPGESVDYLTQLGEPASGVLLGAMRGDDEQARLLAAGIAGFAGLTDLLPEAAPILIEHLKDNAIGGDAEYASSGLLGFGRDVLPYLQESMASPDAQQQSTARLIAFDLLAGPKESPEIRRTMQTISGVQDDPARLGGPQGYGDTLPTFPVARSER